MVSGIWSLVDSLGKTKYVCASITDDAVKDAQALDVAHFITAFLTLCLPLYRLRWLEQHDQPLKSNKKTPQLANLAAVVGIFSFGLVMLIAVKHGTVCSDNNCITNTAVSSALSNDLNSFNAQVASMIGTTAPTESRVFMCNDALNPNFFRVAQNYCSISLKDLFCDSITSYNAERCLVYACSDLVPGRIERYVISLISMLLQISSVYFLILYERSRMMDPMAGQVSPEGYAPVPSSAPAKSLMEDDTEDDPAADAGLMPTPHLRQRKQGFYTSPDPSIKF